MNLAYLGDAVGINGYPAGNSWHIIFPPWEKELASIQKRFFGKGYVL